MSNLGLQPGPKNNGAASRTAAIIRENYTVQRSPQEAEASTAHLGGSNSSVQPQTCILGTHSSSTTSPAIPEHIFGTSSLKREKGGSTTRQQAASRPMNAMCGIEPQKPLPGLTCAWTWAWLCMISEGFKACRAPGRAHSCIKACAWSMHNHNTACTGVCVHVVRSCIQSFNAAGW